MTTTRSLRFAACLTAAFILLPWRAASGGAPVAAAPAASDMVRALQASGPHASLGSGGELLGRFVGTWSIDYTFHSKDGKVTRGSGVYVAGWVMDGSALQVLWLVDPRDGRQDREVYMSLQYLDPKSGTMYLTFIDPQHASPDYQPVARFTGTVEGESRIVLLTQDLSIKGDRTNRWSFEDIGPKSFTFRDEQSSDGGKTWRLLEEDHMTRREADLAATGMRSRPSNGAI